MSKLTHANMRVVYHKFVIFCICPLEYQFTSCTHTSSIVIKFEYSGSRCSVKILVYEHWLVVGPLIIRQIDSG